MLSSFQNDIDTYNEGIGEVVGTIVAVLLLVAGIVWLIKRSRKG
jgi:Ca2+/Na+ antiporter